MYDSKQANIHDRNLKFSYNFFRVFKKGFQKKAVRREDEELRGYMCQWLSWLHPSLLEPGHYTLDTLQTTASLYVQLRLLRAQPPAAVARTTTLLLQVSSSISSVVIFIYLVLNAILYLFSIPNCCSRYVYICVWAVMCFVHDS